MVGSDSTRVLVLDGNQRSALAVTRSLGKRNVEVITADSTPQSLAGRSRYCSLQLQYFSPDVDVERAAESIKKIVDEHEFDYVFPMTDVSTELLALYPSIAVGTKVVSPPVDSYRKLSDKAELLRECQRLSIAAPYSEFFSTAEELEGAPTNIDYPIVVKPNRSRVVVDGKFVSTHVFVVRDRDQLMQAVRERRWLSDTGFILQEFISGHGAGYFSLFERGTEIASFSHRRIREKPPGGGVSVVSESAPIDAVLADPGRRLLQENHWHGPAMIEYRVREDGKPFVMEVNARFWGSLQLAISAGVDFPFLAVSRSEEGSTMEPAGYAVGIRNRWLLGDLDRLYLVFRQKDRPFREKLSELLRFLNVFEPRTRFEVLRISDPRPFAYELRQYLTHGIRSIRSRVSR